MEGGRERHFREERKQDLGRREAELGKRVAGEDGIAQGGAVRGGAVWGGVVRDGTGQCGAVLRGMEWNRAVLGGTGYYWANDGLILD